jgi:hypothetical protein
MAATEQKTNSEVLAIAHNGNLSNGLMFPMVEAFGKRLDRERSALKSGLKREAQLGTNPHKFGMIGSRDSHT